MKYFIYKILKFIRRSFYFLKNTQKNCKKPFGNFCKNSGSVTGCIYQVSENVWEGSYSPRLPNGKRKKFNIYAGTKEECEEKLKELIEKVKAGIKAEKKTRVTHKSHPLHFSIYVCELQILR